MNVIAFYRMKEKDVYLFPFKSIIKATKVIMIQIVVKTPTKEGFMLVSFFNYYFVVLSDLIDTNHKHINFDCISPFLANSICKSDGM